jgi:Curli production assembly/transport component CsgG
MIKIFKWMGYAAVFAAMTGCATMEMGSPDAKTTATGSAAGSSTQNANKSLEKCSKTLGTLAIFEDTESSWYTILTRDWRLGPTTPVLKMLIQQTNCFAVVERGRSMNAAMRERELMQSGELRKKSNFGKGQMVSADYTLTPAITFSNQNAGQVGAAIGGMFGSVGAALGGSMSSKEASVMLNLVDNRSTVQVSAAEGSAKNTDFGFVGGLLSGGVGGVGGGYSNTAEGKVIVAAFTDAVNNMVKAAREYKPQNVEGGLGNGGQLKVQNDDDAAPAKKKSKKVKK